MGYILENSSQILFNKFLTHILYFSNAFKKYLTLSDNGLFSVSIFFRELAVTLVSTQNEYLTILIKSLIKCMNHYLVLYKQKILNII